MAVKFVYKSQSSTVTPIKFYRFGFTTDGDASMKEILGGKGANLAEMSKLGINVPPGFTISCSVSVDYKGLSDKDRPGFLARLWDAVDSQVEELTKVVGHVPLMSVRSGARVSMPGMMDTILNIGLTEATLGKWVDRLGERAALDSYRRLIQMYSTVVYGADASLFENSLAIYKKEAGVTIDSDLSIGDLNSVISDYNVLLKHHLGIQFPTTIKSQLKGAILAVFKSWDSERAIHYRKIHGYPDNWGTAVNVQAMVFGNLGETSATGVVFTRNPSTGIRRLTGEYLVNAQGEDVVAGIRTPSPISQMADWNKPVLNELLGVAKKLEDHYKDMQDIEFTIQDGKLFILQTRNGKRSAKAAFLIARDMAGEGLIPKEVAVTRVTKRQAIELLNPHIDPSFKGEPMLTGIAAGGGVVTGKAVFTSADALKCTGPCILIRSETCPEDIAGINAAVGVLTAVGGITSHAAVVARGMNKACVVGATSMVVSMGEAFDADTALSIIDSDSTITIDGATGRVWLGTVPVIPPVVPKEARDLSKWYMELNNVVEAVIPTKVDTWDSMLKAVREASTSSVYIDTFYLSKVGAFDSIRNAIEKSDKNILLGIRSKYDGLDKEDAFFLSAFHSSVSDEAALLNMLKAEAMKDWSVEVKDKVKVILPEDASKCIKKTLTEYGFSMAMSASTISDIFKADGKIHVPDTMIKSVFGGKVAYKKFMQKFGYHEYTEVGNTYLPWYECFGD